MHYVCGVNIENSKAQMRKGVLEHCILAIISRQHEAYPSDILKHMKEAELLVVEGTLYPLLTRLKNAGLLDYSWVESSSGPPRKYYKLTVKGKTFLKELNKTWKELADSVSALTTNSES
jgi:PadR family transcriptional regulator PadR